MTAACTPPAATTHRVSVASDDRQLDTASSGSSLSADGRFVTFTSDGPDLVAGDTPGLVGAIVWAAG